MSCTCAEEWKRETAKPTIDSRPKPAPTHSKQSRILTDELRQILHEFAITYRPESNETRQEDVDRVLKAIKNQEPPEQSDTLEGLLTSLPYKVIDDYGGKVFGVNLKATASGGWKAWYGEIGKDSEMYFSSGDTPTAAVQALTQKLKEEGIVT